MRQTVEGMCFAFLLSSHNNQKLPYKNALEIGYWKSQTLSTKTLKKKKFDPNEYLKATENSFYVHVYFFILSLHEPCNETNL